MCGIHGFAWRDADGAMGRMVEAARHRGPDGAGEWGDARVTLGHNLLALTADPGPSAQPWHHRGGVMVFNGEVYNCPELKELLAHECRTAADTEVLAAGLHEQGVDFLRRVDGMFALAWYDPAAATLTLARDTNGARPLYYGRLGGRPAFSSEVRSLLALGFDRRVSRDAFRHYYHAGVVAGPLTLFDGVYRLVPGEVLRVDLATGAEARTNLTEAPPPYAGRAAELPGLVAARLRQAVARTASRVRRQGLFLSGGLDSSAVLRELAGLPGPDLRTFTTRFALPHRKCAHNEDADVARELAKLYGATHREVLVDEARWVADFEAAVFALEEPRQAKSLPAYYATNRTAAEAGCKVVLTGDGGDELLLGYKHQLGGPFGRRLEALRAGHRALPDPALALPLAEQEAYLAGWLPAAGLTGDPVNDFMYAESLHTLAEDFLVRGDKLGMAFGMEARFPLLSRVFRDFVRGVPGALKAAPVEAAPSWDRRNKWLLRQAYAARLPDYVLAKGKTGWRAPTDGWVVGIAQAPAPDAGPVRAYLRETLAAPLVRDLFGVTAADVEYTYLNNRVHAGPPKPSGKPSPGPGLAAQKELFTVATFAAWARLFGMRLW